MRMYRCSTTPHGRCHSASVHWPPQLFLLLGCFLLVLRSCHVHAFSTQPHSSVPLPLPLPVEQRRRRSSCWTEQHLGSGFSFQLYDASPKGSSTTTIETVAVEKAETTTTTTSQAPSGPYLNENGVISVPGTTAFAVIGTQSLLVPLAIGLSYLCETPNYGFGPNIEFSLQSLVAGCVYTVPLAILAVTLDKIEDKVPALQEVTKATQRAVVSFLGSEFRLLPTLLAAIGIGLAAGFGEELLFRGVFQYGLVEQLNVPLAAGIGVTAIVFGLLHAATPLYVVLAGLASVYFGSLYAAYGNLAIPIVTHAVYDVGALVYAHWEIGRKTPEELQELFANSDDADEQ